LDTQRRAFLADLKAELTTPQPPGPTPARSIGRSRKGLGMKRAVAGALLASASFIAFSAPAAHAASASAARTPVVAQDSSCWVPDAEPWDHTKYCGSGAFMSYKFLYDEEIYPYYWCFTFDAYYYGCGGSTYVGRRSACAYE
jgi:hypothetical protein